MPYYFILLIFISKFTLQTNCFVVPTVHFMYFENILCILGISDALFCCHFFQLVCKRILVDLKNRESTDDNNVNRDHDTLL